MVAGTKSHLHIRVIQDRMENEKLGTWRGLEKRNVGTSCSKLSERKQSPVGSAWLRNWGFSPFIAS